MRRRTWGAGTAIALLTAFWSYHILTLRSGLERRCHSYWDLGIYAQALKRMGWREWNPEVPTRGLRIFNDHADPVLWLAKIPQMVMPPHMALIGMDLLAATLACWPLVWLWRRQAIHGLHTLLLMALMLFNVGTTSAMQFPGHPTGWAMAPLAWMVAACRLQRYGWAALAFCLAMACKEEFCFIGPPLALALAWRGHRRAACAMVLLGLGGVGIAHWLRPALVGTVEPYGARIIGPLLHAPMVTLLSALRFPALYKRPLFLLLMCLPMLLWAARRRRFPLEVIAALMPLLAIRLVAGAWRLHYMAPVMALMVAGMAWQLPRERLPRHVVVLTLFLLLAGNAPYVMDTVYWMRGHAAGSWARCPDDIERLRTLSEAENDLAVSSAPALIGPNLALGKLLHREDMRIFPSPTTPTSAVFAHILMEKPPFGGIWGDDAMMENLARWRQESDVIAVDSPTLFYAHGRFTMTE